ncbi:HK97-gp10 family putative phage morphogenesis protein [Heyndrickxia sp. MSNUG]|uniref:HK97-gp10 family putative phage morphogenesis protein n=1 Tax=Heyndrickxia sp. MSNUG TaxID=3136677 RepID=UPI003C2C026C
MPMPRSVTRVTRDGITYVSNVDRAQYTLRELMRAALRDIAKLLRKRMLQKARTMPGMKRGKRIPNAFQYWNRRREADLQIGVKHSTWYGTEQELGTSNQPKRSIIRSTVYDNIADIRIIAGKYIKEIENENRAMGLINEEEDVGDDAGN